MLLFLAESLDKTLSNKSVENLVAANKSAIDVVGEILDAFSQNFSSQITKSSEEQAKLDQKYLHEKAEGLQSLYTAAGAFGAFLLIVFLSIIIKIERNLRPPKVN